MANHQDDLDLLLSLQDRVLETPPASPSAHSPGYLSDNEVPKRTGQAGMSVFRDAVQDYLDHEPETAHKAPKTNKLKNSRDPEVEKFSGLRIRNQLVSDGELSNRFSDIRFVRLPAIKNLMLGDTLSGCWATVGVLAEKSTPKLSSTGKNYCIWKIGCLDEKIITIFLFGDAYQRNWKEEAGTVFAFFNSGVRKDALGTGFSLSVYNANQVLKIGTSIDYGVCKGKRKDGMACTLIINKRRGIYCRYHKSKSSEKYSVMRTELKGGNLRTAFRDLKSEGIYLVDPLADRMNLKKAMQPVKLMSVDGLKKALSNAGKVTTNTHSQGIRFLTQMAGKTDPKATNQQPIANSNSRTTTSDKRSSSTMKSNPSKLEKKPENVKRMKSEQGQSSGKLPQKMIELEVVSSDDEFCFF